MDGERSASENLAQLKKKKIVQNSLRPKPRLIEHLETAFSVLTH